MTRVGDGNRKHLPIVVFLVLLLSLGVQLSVALHRTLTGDRPGGFPAPYAVGDTVRFLEAVESNGKQVRVSLAGGDGTATVVYAFHTECVHCRAVAPAWTQHFANSGSASGHVRRVAVTEEDPATAGQYATRFRWHHVDVLSLADLPSKDRRRLLVSRTPWVFVFDSAGVLLHHGYGGNLDRIQQAIGSPSG